MITEFIILYSSEQAVPSRFATTSNIALPATIFDTVGGFDPLFKYAAGEDREFCYRLQQQGFHLTYDPLIIVHHFHNLSFHSFLQQQFKYGRGAFLFHQKRKAEQTTQKRFEQLSFYIDLLSWPFRSQPANKLILFSLTALAQVAITAGYLTEIFSKNIFTSEHCK